MRNKEVAIVSDGGKVEWIWMPEGKVIVMDQPYYFSPLPKGTKVLSPDGAKELLAQNKIPTYKCNVKK